MAPNHQYLKFDVTGLEILEPPNEEDPADIVPVGGSFDLKVTFAGSRSFWTTLKKLGCGYEARFYAEGQGFGTPDIDFGIVAGNLVDGKDIYEAVLSVPMGISAPGIYEVRCMVVTQHAGMVGRNDPPVIVTVGDVLP